VNAYPTSRFVKWWCFFFFFWLAVWLLSEEWCCFVGSLGHILRASHQHDDRARFVGGIYESNQTCKSLNSPLYSSCHWLVSRTTLRVCDRVHFAFDWTSAQRAVRERLCSLCFWCDSSITRFFSLWLYSLCRFLNWSAMDIVCVLGDQTETQPALSVPLRVTVRDDRCQHRALYLRDSVPWRRSSRRWLNLWFGYIKKVLTKDKKLIVKFFFFFVL
jgi:hypothetical protein